MSQLGDIVPDHFFQHSGDASTEVSTNLNIGAFCDEIKTNHGESKSRTISLIEWHKEPGMLHHEYLLVRVRVPGRKEVWIRLERAAKRNARKNLLAPTSVISHYPPDDNVSRSAGFIVTNLTKLSFRQRSRGLAMLSSRPLASLSPACHSIRRNRHRAW